MCTADNIFILHGLVTHFLNSNKKLFCSFIDFSKAFDYVVRDILWFKLLQFGVRCRQSTIVILRQRATRKSKKEIEPRHENTCCMPNANNKGADQPAHPRSLISAFVVRSLDIIISLVSILQVFS